MSTDWGSFGDRAYWKATDIALIYDSTDSAGKNITAPHCFGGTDWTGGFAGLSAFSGVNQGRAVSGYFSHNSAGSAGLWRIDHVSADIHAFFFGPSTYVGGITTNGSATAYNTTSDYRLKEDLVEIADPVGRLKALRTVNFRWKASGIRADGFLAHEVAAVVPDAVHGEKDAVDTDGNILPQGLDQSKLVPLLVAALQAEIAAREALEARIAALEAAAG